MTEPRQRARLLSAVLLLLLGGGACSRGPTRQEPRPPATTRTWRMGFAPTPPVLTTESLLAGVDAWGPRAELTIFHEELPWTDLLAGMPPADILQRDKVELVAYLRARGLGIVWMSDLTDGLSRGEEAPQLRALGRSLAEPAVQQVARDYVLAVAVLLQPEYLGLAAETNLIRAAAPSPVYAAVVATANATAADLLAAGVPSTLCISVQVETAWGLLVNSSYIGIAQDLDDFPFAEAIGLSSYPYFVFDTPDAMPADYYQRLVETTSLPVFVAEGGWTSASVGAVVSSPELQARYFERQAELLDSVHATAWLQLLYADPDLSTWPSPLPAN
ncbi:MAG TPA: hypothetical protein VFZ65_10655, partial [Planctomycetota bacterium]|nr:hypothetical protein [Planctomycetota bacterium]